MSEAFRRSLERHLVDILTFGLTDAVCDGKRLIAKLTNIDLFERGLDWNICYTV